MPGVTSQAQGDGRGVAQPCQALRRTAFRAGIDLLADPQCLDAFRIANKCMADAARQRQGVMQQKPPGEVKPTWRPFQLAFILMNLKAIADPTDDDRETVDLLFFPTGGGKTEAYLGLAAFTLLAAASSESRDPVGWAQRADALHASPANARSVGTRGDVDLCLELVRRNDVDKFGEWPFEIGLWVGRAATPNRMGSKGDNDPNTARARTRRFWDSDKNPSPIPLEECPWCGTKFTRQLLPASSKSGYADRPVGEVCQTGVRVLPVIHRCRSSPWMNRFTDGCRAS